MTAVATTRPRATVSDRLLAAVPLASIYLWLSIVYCVEAWKRQTPWLFTDELEFTQLSRSIAETGHAARRGDPHSFRSLYVVLTAPFWLIDDVSAAFSTIKYFDVLVMTAVLFPAYGLARLFVGRNASLFAAACAAAIPSLAYSSWIVEETLAYPYATLCVYLIARTLLVPSRDRIALAVAATALAPAVKGELVVIPITFALALLLMWWSGERMRLRRATWSVRDWLGVVALFFGAVYLLSGYASHHSHEWFAVTTYYKHRIFIFGDWATGALAAGTAVIPLALGVAALAPLDRADRSPQLRVFRCVALATIAAVWTYTAMKGAYLSTVFASRVEERNLIYIAPVLFVGTALVLERRRINLWALALTAAYTLYVVVGTPLHVGGGLYSDALGLAGLQQANRYFLLSDGTAQWLLVSLLVFGLVAVVALTRLGPRAGTAVAGILAVVILAWNVTGEIAAAAGNVTVSRDVAPALGEPFTWVDDNTHLKPTLYLAQGVGDQNPEWLLEFWNRSIKTVSSLDATIGGPGPAGAPNITTGGELYWTLTPSDPGKIFDYAVEDWPCVDFAGTHVATHFYRGGATRLRQWRLVQLTKPNRLRAFCTGIYPDGWSGANDSTYFRFAGRRAGWLRVRLARPGFAGSRVDVQIGTLVRRHNQPVVDRITRHVRRMIPRDGSIVVWIPTPAAALGASAVVLDKFVPRDVNPESGDVRVLGAQVSYRWFSQRP